VHIEPVRPAQDAVLARALLELQRAAYAVEAELIGDDRIPPLHEQLDDLVRAPLSWLAAMVDGRPVGAIAWSGGAGGLDVDRLVVAPGAQRAGVGRRLVQTVLDTAGSRRTTVSTARANTPARRLYEQLGFVRTWDVEVLPGLWVSHHVRDGDAAG